jgi:hypothetical protein
MTAWGRKLFTAIFETLSSDEGPYVKLFRIEYGREYNQLIESGYRVTEEDAKRYLKSMA